MKKQLTAANTKTTKVLGVTVRAEPKTVAAYERAVDDLGIALRRLWHTLTKR